MQSNTTNKVKMFTIKDYTKEVEALIEEDRARTERIMRRIDESMDVLHRTQLLLGKRPA